jgi:hypothetical protein
MNERHSIEELKVVPRFTAGATAAQKRAREGS